MRRTRRSRRPEGNDHANTTPPSQGWPAPPAKRKPLSKNESLASQAAGVRDEDGQAFAHPRPDEEIGEADMSLSLSFNTLSLRWNHAPHSLVEGMAATSEMAFVGLDAEDAADFMAQISEETGGGTAIEENLNYTA